MIIIVGLPNTRLLVSILSKAMDRWHKSSAVLHVVCFKISWHPIAKLREGFFCSFNDEMPHFRQPFLFCKQKICFMMFAPVTELSDAEPEAEF